jgi:hypothetical protein
VLALLLPLHLPAMQEELPGVVRSIFFLLQRGGATASLTMQACFKALTVLLREAKGKLQLSSSQVLTFDYLYMFLLCFRSTCLRRSRQKRSLLSPEFLPAGQVVHERCDPPTTTYYCILMRTNMLVYMLVYCCILIELSPSQLKVLLSFAKLDILESGRQAVAFGLVRAIIARKLVCEEVYELVDTISEHMVTSQSEQTRALSAHTLLQVRSLLALLVQKYRY